MCELPFVYCYLLSLNNCPHESLPSNLVISHRFCSSDSSLSTDAYSPIHLTPIIFVWIENIRNTCVSTGNSSSPEAKPRWKDGRGFNSDQRPLLNPLNRLLNFWSDQMNSRSRLELERLPALAEATCIRHIGHRLMIPYTGREWARWG